MPRTLRTGMTGDDVVQMQHWLNRSIPPLKTPKLKEDGIFGPKTLAALRAFQALKGLDADGAYGPNSQAALACFHVVDDEAAFRASTRRIWALKVYLNHEA